MLTRLWRLVSVFRCHHPATPVVCPYCGTDVTDVYQQAPWWRPYTRYTGVVERRQQCPACFRSWRVEGGRG